MVGKPGRAMIFAAATELIGARQGKEGGNREGESAGAGVLNIMNGRSRMTIDSRIPKVPGRSTPGFHRPGRHCLYAPSTKRREVLGESHEG